ncbi:MAG: glycosyltransferase family 4 protein [Spirochaetales bacterium]|nr:glycosyltransferase family 4 protein [Spirochaetales bacterium]
MRSTPVSGAPRVLFISDHFFPESFLGNEIPPALRSAGCRVDVLTQNPAYPEGEIYEGEANPFFRITRMDGIRVFRFLTVTGYRDSVPRKVANYLSFMVLSSLFALVAAPAYDAVFVYHVGTLTEALPLFIAKRLYGKRTSIWTLDIWPDTVFSFGFRRTRWLAALLDAFASAIYRSCDAVLVGSPGFVERIGAYRPRSGRPLFVPHWAPAELFESGEMPFELDRASTNFVFAGNVGTQQNLEILVDAFGRPGPEGADVTLHIVGNGRSLEGLKQRARNLDAARVVFHDRIPQTRVLALLRSADACVLPLKSDTSVELTLPSKFQAYLHAGRPILCVAGGESKRMVEAHDLGEAAEPDSLPSVVAAIGRICAYSEERKAGIRERMLGLARGSFRREAALELIRRAITGSPGDGTNA